MLTLDKPASFRDGIQVDGNISICLKLLPFGAAIFQINLAYSPLFV